MSQPEMNPTDVTVEISAEAKASRKALRESLLGANAKPAHRIIMLFGCEIEMRQPSFKSIMDARDIEEGSRRAAQMIVKYAYVPGTDELLFTNEDIDHILSWPFGDDLSRLNKAISELTGVDIEAEETKLENDPLVESS